MSIYQKSLDWFNFQEKCFILSKKENSRIYFPPLSLKIHSGGRVFMLKRMIILGTLSIILVVLVLVKSQTTSTVTNDNNDSSEYVTIEYTISKITENQYYGESDDGKEIIFSAGSIESGEKFQVDDVVICYFERDNFGKGIVKVEKK